MQQHKITRIGKRMNLHAFFKGSDNPAISKKSKMVVSAGLLCLMFCTFSCSDQIMQQERLVAIKHQAWTQQNKPWVHLNIEDSTIPYRIYAVIRHNQQFKYDNLLLRYGYISPGDSAIFQEVNLPLAVKGKWLGDTLGTTIETRIRLSSTDRRLPVGDNVFVLEHLMPDEPLNGILQVGIRIEAAGAGNGSLENGQVLASEKDTLEASSKLSNSDSAGLK